MIGTINTAALALGYLILLLFAVTIALVIFKPLLSYLAWRGRSDEAKQMGAAMQKKHGYDSGASALIADMVLEEMDNLGIDAHLDYNPQPVAQIDWSIDKPNSTDLNVLKSALTDAGYHVHPFPRERDGEWSQENAGVWKKEPKWYIQDGEERREVTPDTHAWDTEE